MIIVKNGFKNTYKASFYHKVLTLFSYSYFINTKATLLLF